jgi:site-specific DNA-methyltransferase (adenine-specific)
MTYEIFQGDCRELLRDLPDECIDAIVTDPPYGLEFMGKDWDAPWQASSKSSLFGQRETPMPGFGNQRNANCRKCGGRLRGSKRCQCAKPDWDEPPTTTNNRQMAMFQLWCEEWARECLRVLKPGGHLLAFGGTRTYHRMACAIEDAGFEVRDSIHWIYGSGFPKSMNVEKAGAGEAWQGWGTALKPAHEPIVVARKPLIGTVAANVQAHGTGALNIDGTRVAYASEADFAKLSAGVQAIKERGGSMENSWKNSSDLSGANDASTIGRWPANILLNHSPECGDECAEDCPVAEMDRQSGVSKSKPTRIGQRGGRGFGMFDHEKSAKAIGTWPADPGGGSSRFFPCFKYEAKAGRKERERGCESLPAKTGAQAVEREEGSDGLNSPRAGAGRTAAAVRNVHPTVKPIELMRWLVKLVTPPSGVVLDPFTGSGTTGVACVLEGFDFIGFEQSAEYVEIAEARIADAQRNK